MDLYDRHVLPKLMHLAMSLPQLHAYRQRTVGQAREVVLELGFGSGLNLPFYDAARVSRLVALEPAGSLLRLAKGRISHAPFPVEVLQTGAERIPLADASVDTVVCTSTLCSIPGECSNLGSQPAATEAVGVPNPGYQRARILPS